MTFDKGKIQANLSQTKAQIQAKQIKKSDFAPSAKKQKNTQASVKKSHKFKAKCAIMKA